MPSVFLQRLHRLWGRLPSLWRGVLMLLMIAAVANLGVLWQLRRRSAIRHKFDAQADVTYGRSTVSPLVEKRVQHLLPYGNTPTFSPAESANLHSPEEDAFESLSAFATLKHLGVTDGELTGNALSRIRDLNELESLYLGNARFEPNALSGLPTCRHLRRLKLVGALNAEVLHPLGRCLSLTELHLDAGYYEHNHSEMLTKRLTGAHLAAVARIPNLKRLVISSNDLVDRDLTPLKEADQLEELFVDSMVLTGNSLNSLGTLPRLKCLMLEVNKAGPQALQGLTGFAELQILALRGNGIQSKHLVQLRKLKRLETLCLERTDLQESLEPVARVTQLQNLNLFLAQLPSDGLRQLERLDHLQELCLGFREEMAGNTPEELRQRFPRAKNVDTMFATWTVMTEIPPWEAPTSRSGFGMGFF